MGKYWYHNGKIQTLSYTSPVLSGDPNCGSRCRGEPRLRASTAVTSDFGNNRNLDTSEEKGNKEKWSHQHTQGGLGLH